MLLIYIFIIVMIFSLVPVIVNITKKASEGATMRHNIEKAGGIFIPTHTFWYMGAIDSKKCDFHVIYDKRVISVKVISFLYQNVSVNFIDDVSYEIGTVDRKKSGKSKNKLRKKAKKPYDFRASLKNEYSSLPSARIILFNTPTPAKVTRVQNGITRDLNYSESTGEGELYNTYGFIRLFK